MAKAEAAPTRSTIGVQVEDQRGGGARVAAVVPASPADGILQPGDVILEVNREPVTGASDLGAKVKRSTGDKPLLLRVERDDAQRFVAIDRS